MQEASVDPRPLVDPSRELLELAVSVEILADRVYMPTVRAQVLRMKVLAQR